MTASPHEPGRYGDDETARIRPESAGPAGSGSYPPPPQGYGPGYPSDQGYGDHPQQGYGQQGYDWQGYPPAAQPYAGHAPQPGHGYGAPQPHVPGVYGPRPGSDDTTMAMLAHLSGLANLLFWPLGMIGSLVIYLTRKDQAPYVRDQAAEALNLWITLSITFIAVTLVSFILSFVLIGLIGFLLLPLLWIYGLIIGIMGTTAANRGENYRYPAIIRMVS